MSGHRQKGRELMTLSEFKAWFEGYAEGLEGAPTKAQFDRIKEKVKEIDGTPIMPFTPSPPTYIDRDIATWPRPSPMWPYYITAVGPDVSYWQSGSFGGAAALRLD